MTGKPGANIEVPGIRQERPSREVYAQISESWVLMGELYEELGRSLSEERRMRGLSQEALGSLTGLSRDQICLYELGRRWKRDVPAIEMLVLFLSR